MDKQGAPAKTLTEEGSIMWKKVQAFWEEKRNTARVCRDAMRKVKTNLE